MRRALLLALAAALLPSCGDGGGTTIIQTGFESAQLSALAASTGTLSPVFSPGTTFYMITPTLAGPPNLASHVTVTPTAAQPGATLRVNGTLVASGSSAAPIPLSEITLISIAVTSPDGLLTLTYSLLLFRDGAPSQTAQQDYLKASNTGTGDQYGLSVAVSGDTLVVGAISEDSNATGVNAPLTGGSGTQADNSASNAGAAYVFTRSAGVWSPQAYLKASNAGAGDLFGWSVAVSGDTLVVGAFSEDGNATGVNAPLSGGSGAQDDNSALGSGAAYVFTRSAGVWSQQAYLKASNTGTGDHFGWSVAVSGDTLVVGAPDEDSNATGVNAPLTGGSGTQDNNGFPAAGAAYVFTRSAGVWSQQAYLKASYTSSGNQFGYSAAVSGDTVVVGAPGESSNATGVNAPLSGGSGTQDDDSIPGAGAAYVFTRSAGVWSQQAYFKASNTGDDGFGLSVAVSDDTLVVGAPGEDSNATGVNAPLTGGSGTQDDNSAAEAGAAYVFIRSAGVWSQQAYLKASNTGAADLFGDSVAISGDTVVVGADGESSNATGINAPLTGGSGTQDDDSVPGAGAAYVFTRSAGVWSQRAYLKASNPGGDDRFGYSVAVSVDTLVVGAFDEDGNATGVNAPLTGGSGTQADNSFPGAGAAYVIR